MSTTARLIASILVAGSLLAACGDDDDATTSGTADGAAVPAADTAFDGFKSALEAEGLAVTSLPAASLEGAEAGVEISGDRAGSARLFSSSSKAAAYAERAESSGDATSTVGTVV